MAESKFSLPLLAFLHLLVDGLCASVVYEHILLGKSVSGQILLYNTLAFATQSLVGLAADRIRRHREGILLSLGLLLAGAVLPVPFSVRILLIGSGNSIFHVAGGSITLERSEGKAGPLGVFVAPGAIGLTLGTLFPFLKPVFSLLLLLGAGLTGILGSKVKPSLRDEKRGAALPADPLLPSLLLAAAVAVRAIGGSAASFPWKKGALFSLLMTAFVFLGKTAGGFLCDRIGPARTALVSIPAAALLTAFGASWMVPSLAGQFLLNLTMPVTLWLMYCLMPDMPGYAFGLAAAALWPGTLTGRLITLTGPAASALILACFLFGLWAILSARKAAAWNEGQ